MLKNQRILNHIGASPFKPAWILNGDSLYLGPWPKTLKSKDTKKTATINIASNWNQNRHRYGSVSFDDNHIIKKFLEKKSNGSGFINTGVYLTRPNILLKTLNQFRQHEISIEKDLF
ncbi:MAG: sugar phosphate nucleotidyltransferase, partial [Pseudomonadota bacterium]